MAITYDDNRPLNYHEFKGTSQDNKPTNCAVNSIFGNLTPTTSIILRVQRGKR